MTRSTTAAATLLLALTACTATPPPATPASAPPPRPPRVIGLGNDGIIGQSAGALQAMFGTAVSSLTEGPARKLQFAGPVCVLDAYLYPPARGGEPAVTHVDTRRPTGEDIDRASCVAALRAQGLAR